jgi:hypothetical protein
VKHRNQTVHFEATEVELQFFQEQNELTSRSLIPPEDNFLIPWESDVQSDFTVDSFSNDATEFLQGENNFRDDSILPIRAIALPWISTIRTRSHQFLIFPPNFTRKRKARARTSAPFGTESTSREKKEKRNGYSTEINLISDANNKDVIDATFSDEINCVDQSDRDSEDEIAEIIPVLSDSEKNTEHKKTNRSENEIIDLTSFLYPPNSADSINKKQNLKSTFRSPLTRLENLPQTIDLTVTHECEK